MRAAIVGLTAALFLPTAPTPAQEPAGGAKVYRQAIPSVVWVHSARTGGRATGSGSLIDRDRRLVLTNYHVVGDTPKATVFFPVFRDARPVPEREFYLDRIRRLGTPARVVALDKQADLAVLQLNAVPDGTAAIPLAPDSPGPGDTVHSIGNAGQSGALWGYVRGTVRQVYRKKWRARLGATQVATFEAKVIETDSPTNPGDSGGPLLDDAGRLVGVTQGGAVEAQSLSYFVDVSEVKQLLARREVRDLPGGRPAAKPADAPVARTGPPPVRDEAKLFSPEATKTAAGVLEELFRRDLDVLVETHPIAPAEWAEQARKATPDERQKLFRTWAAERAKLANADGVMVLVSLDPRYVLVDIPPKWQDRFPEGFAQQVADVLIRGLRGKDFDAGLKQALGLIRDNFREAKK